MTPGNSAMKRITCFQKTNKEIGKLSDNYGKVMASVFGVANFGRMCVCVCVCSRIFLASIS